MDNQETTPSSESNYFETLVKHFDDWQKHHFVLMKEKAVLVEKLKHSQEEQLKYCTQIEEQSNTLKEMQDMTDRLHKQLHRLCDLDIENRDLKVKLAEKDTEVDKLKQIQKGKENDHKRSLDKVEEHHKIHTEKVRKELEDEMKHEINVLTDMVREKNRDIEMLKKQASEIKQESEAKVLKITMDYENKLARLHREKLAAASVSQPSFTNQEIFRKKMQHMKSEYEKELSLLKSTLSDLQTKLESHKSPLPGGRLSLSSFSAKKRRL